MSKSHALRLTPACIKTLTKVEVDPTLSHQREFNGVYELKQMFGLKRNEFTANFSVRGENLAEKAEVTWYEARESHPTRSEYRLYYKPNNVMANASVGDNIIIGFDAAQQLHIVLIKKESRAWQGEVYEWKTL